VSWLARLFGAQPAAPIDARRWVVLDVETTGLDMRHDHLLAIAAVALRFDAEGAAPRIAIEDSFEAVLQHESASTDKENILLHGIGVGAQRAGAPPREVLADFGRWAAASPLLGYHAVFDQTMIARATQQHLGRTLPNAWLDLAPVASGLYPDAGARALDDWLERFGIPCAVRHQAASDTLATAELLLRLWPMARTKRCNSFEGLSALAKHQRWLASS
jgi:DNA polymerase III subunit epsilon